MKLDRRQVEKPWGRTALPPPFGDTGGRRIGEIWFADPYGRDLPLLVKYIFTSEKLSVQVHPDDEEARAAASLRPNALATKASRRVRPPGRSSSKRLLPTITGRGGASRSNASGGRDRTAPSIVVRSQR